jgi:hypothetical protein
MALPLPDTNAVSAACAGSDPTARASRAMPRTPTRLEHFDLGIVLQPAGVTSVTLLE